MSGNTGVPFRRSIAGGWRAFAILAAIGGSAARAQDAQNPTFVLPDGSVVPLQRLEDLPAEERPNERENAADLSAAPVPLLASVDLRAQQTPIKSQGGRDTCTVFATTAAVEAAYSRDFGLTLDLSEQYLNHVQKSHWLNTAAQLPAAEIQPNTNGGGNVPWQLGVLTRYGLPPENTMPYIGAWDYQVTSQPGDRPFGLDAATPTQRLIDDFNLADEPADYATPAPLRATIFPRAAAEQARYTPTQTAVASGSQRSDLNWYRQQLADEREVMIGFRCCGTAPATAADVWQPGNVSGLHALLIVGYDDSKQAFLVKNSWGGSTFPWFSYNFVTQGYVYEAATIHAVATPWRSFGSFDNRQLFLGRWTTDLDGWKGTLDIYRLPDPNNPSGDRRIGTFFDANGRAFRVNATLTGNRIDFYIDPNNPNLDYRALRGDHYTAYIFSRDYSSMAGTVRAASDGNTWAFQASKTTLRTGRTTSTRLEPTNYLGTWYIAHDGQPSTITFSSVDPNTRELRGTYMFEGRQLTVTGRVSADPRVVTFSIPFTSGSPQVFQGYLNGHERGVMSGTTVWSGLTFGFWAYRM